MRYLRFLLESVWFPPLLVLISALTAGAPAAGVEGGNEPRPVLKVKELAASPEKLAGREIIAVGMFLGHAGRCPRPAPVDGGAWMLQDDENACIYVSGAEPEGFSADREKGIGAAVAAAGLLKQSGNSYYLEAAADQAGRSDEEKKMLGDLLRRQAANSGLTLTVSDIFNYRELLEGTVFLAKGLYRGESGCRYPGPELKEEMWVVEDLSGGCIFAKGPRPAPGGKPAEEGALVSFRALVAESGNRDGRPVPYLKALEAWKKSSGARRGGGKKESSPEKLIGFEGELKKSSGGE